MNDTQRNPADPHDQATRPTSGDTLMANPFDETTRALVRRWLTNIADVFLEGLADVPTDAELREMEVDAAEWVHQNEATIERLRATAQRIGEDPLAFSVAVEVRTMLEALETSITAAVPAHLDAEAVEQNKAQRGFHVQVVGGRGEPFPLPSFAYTDGLTDRAGHPELVIVGTSTHVAAALLEDLGVQILAGKRTLQAGEDLDGLLACGDKLRVIDCPAPLLDQVQHPDRPVGVLQLLIPDSAGRFPGDPSVDAKFADAQQYPAYPG